MSDKPCKATPPDELLEQLLDCRVPKTEREHFAASKIEHLQAENQRLRDALEVIRQAGDTPNRWQWDCIIAREALEVGSVLELTTGVE
jgi:hypothetical protein